MLRVVTNGRHPPESSLQHLRRDFPGQEILLLDHPAQLSTPLRRESHGTVDLLHVPSASTLDAHRGVRFARHASGSTVGVLADDEGVVTTRVSKPAFERFFDARGAQADASVYLDGARFRAGDPPDGQVPMPRQVYLGLTQRCNRSCLFCVSRTFSPDRLSVLEVRRLAEQLRGVQVIALTGAGEAMVHPDFWDIMDMLCELLPQATFKMNTSGVALAAKAERLLRYPVKNITVSLNAARPATYEKVVGRGFDTVLGGIQRLVETRVESGRTDLRLCLSMVLMNSTIEEMPDLVTTAFQLGVEEVQGIYLMINEAALAAESPWHCPEVSNAWLDRAERRAASLAVQTSLPPRFRIGRTLRDAAQVTSLPTTQGQRCVEAWSTIYVRPNGDLLPCPYFERSMGNLRRASLEQVWQGDEYQELRRGLVTGELCAECRTCCGFNEAGAVDDYASHWIGRRGKTGPPTALEPLGLERRIPLAGSPIPWSRRSGDALG